MKSLRAITSFWILLTVAVGWPRISEASPLPTLSCPAGTINILDWLTLDTNDTHKMTGSHQLGSYYNPSSYPGMFFWMKNQYNWDVQKFDAQFVYHWITEIDGWSTDGRSFKKHITPMKMAPRCAATGYPGSVITTTDTAAQYRRTINCSQQSPQGLGYVVWELWGPYTAGCPGAASECAQPNPLRSPIGGVVQNTTQVYTLAYRYGCDAAYASCSTKEEFILAKEFGLVRWQVWNWAQCPGQPLGFKCYVPGSVSNFNSKVSGTLAPIAPCSGTFN